MSSLGSITASYTRLAEHYEAANKFRRLMRAHHFLVAQIRSLKSVENDAAVYVIIDPEVQKVYDDVLCFGHGSAPDEWNGFEDFPSYFVHYMDEQMRSVLDASRLPNVNLNHVYYAPGEQHRQLPEPHERGAWTLSSDTFTFTDNDRAIIGSFCLQVLATIKHFNRSLALDDELSFTKNRLKQLFDPYITRWW